MELNSFNRNQDFVSSCRVACSAAVIAQYTSCFTLYNPGGLEDGLSSVLLERCVVCVPGLDEKIENSEVFIVIHLIECPVIDETRSVPPTWCNSVIVAVEG